jgi:hypothetical protein
VSARPRRRNARRTWDDGSGCPQRPLYPHRDGCIGWDWGIDENGDALIERCTLCRIFDDDEDAAEHVRRCRVCSELLAEDMAALKQRLQKKGAKAATVRQRRVWADWANTLAGRRNRPLLHQDSDSDDLVDWLADADPNGDWRRAYRELEDDETTTVEEFTEEAWRAIGEMYDGDQEEYEP